ncbi:hypothetical protein EV121DRAFT_274844, partial [Schizophyllum commune]
MKVNVSEPEILARMRSPCRSTRGALYSGYAAFESSNPTSSEDCMEARKLEAGRVFPQSESALRSASTWSYRAPNTPSDSAVLRAEKLRNRRQLRRGVSLGGQIRRLTSSAREVLVNGRDCRGGGRGGAQRRQERRRHARLA